MEKSQPETGAHVEVTIEAEKDATTPQK